MDASGDGVVSFYEYTTLQLQLIQPEDYGTTVRSLQTLLPQVAAHRKAEKERVAEEKRLVKAAKARAFNYRLEQILSAHGGAAAVVVGSGSASGRHYTDDDSNLILGDGARVAVRGWDNHGPESESHPEQRLHWSGEKQTSGLRMSQLPMENLTRLAGTHPRSQLGICQTARISRMDVDYACVGLMECCLCLVRRKCLRSSERKRTSTTQSSPSKIEKLGGSTASSRCRDRG